MAEGLLDDFPRGDPGRMPENTRPDGFKAPSAQFTAPFDISRRKELQHGPGSIFLGVVGGYVEDEDDPRERHVLQGVPIGVNDDRHMVTIAGSRSGKGRAAVVPNMLTYPGSVLTTDPKGELATITARQRSEGLGQAVWVLDPFNVAQGFAAERRVGFNPLQGMRSKSLVEDAALIADALVPAGSDDPHWDDSARSFIEGVILHVRTAEHFKGVRHLIMVGKLVAQGAMDEATGKSSMDALKAAMERNPFCGGAVQAAAADLFQRPEKERSSVLSTARRHLKFLSLPGIQDVLSRHSFDLRDLKTKKTTIYLCLPARHMGTCSRWLRLFINLLLQAMEQVKGEPAGGFPVLMVLDEFASLGHMRQIEDAAGQIAGFGVKLWPILQDLGQLKALYKERWETFLGNAGVLQFFGNNDLTTLEWISKRCGRTTIEAIRVASLSPAQMRDGAKRESAAPETHDLLTVDEAARYFNRDDPKHRQLVLWSGIPFPLVLQRVFYDKHHAFAGKWDKAPKPVQENDPLQDEVEKQAEERQATAPPAVSSNQKRTIRLARSKLSTRKD